MVCSFRYKASIRIRDISLFNANFIYNSIIFYIKRKNNNTIYFGWFIDNNWTLHKRILNFCVSPSHKGREIGKVIELYLLDWGIENVCSITVDNATSNDVAIDYLKKMTSKKKVLHFPLSSIGYPDLFLSLLNSLLLYYHHYHNIPGNINLLTLN